MIKLNNDKKSIVYEKIVNRIKAKTREYGKKLIFNINFKRNS